MDQTGCDHCLPDDAAAAWEAQRGHVTLARPVDESHHSVTLLACRHCGQRFVKVFAETIDWVDGEDPQHWRLMPVSAEEAGQLMAGPDPVALPHRRSVAVDHPKEREATVHWGWGVEVRCHD
jgi:hypothetical protein